MPTGCNPADLLLYSMYSRACFTVLLIITVTQLLLLDQAELSSRYLRDGLTS